VETTWHENGTKMSEVEYRDGTPQGRYVYWLSDGVKASEGECRDGKLKLVWFDQHIHNDLPKLSTDEACWGGLYQGE